jgi:hypothetical protein
VTFGFSMMTVGTLLLISGVRNRSIAEVMEGVFSSNPGGPGEGETVPTAQAGEQNLPGKGVNPFGVTPGHPELKPGVSAAVATIIARFPGLSVGSTLRPGDTDSRHSEGRAADLVGSAQEMNKAARWIEKYMVAALDEGIHNPGLSVDTHHKVPSSFWGAQTWAEHANHIHVAV